MGGLREGRPRTSVSGERQGRSRDSVRRRVLCLPRWKGSDQGPGAARRPQDRIGQGPAPRAPRSPCPAPQPLRAPHPSPGSEQPRSSHCYFNEYSPESCIPDDLTGWKRRASSVVLIEPLKVSPRISDITVKVRQQDDSFCAIDSDMGPIIRRRNRLYSALVFLAYFETQASSLLCRASFGGFWLKWTDLGAHLWYL